MKKTVIFFDVEADLVSQAGENKEYIKRIFDLLEEKQVKATFNTCGKVIERFPHLFKRIDSRGYEISSHTYNHENIVELNEEGLNNTLKKTEFMIRKVTGKNPVGFRSPWLYTKPLLYKVLVKRGYKWVSNKRIRRKEMLKNPIFQFSNSFIDNISKLLIGSYMTMQWQFFPKKPFLQNGLMHVPLLSSMDGELLGLIDCNQKSSQQQINYVTKSLQNQFFQAKDHFNVTFHDWIVGSMNRIEILSLMVNFLKKNSKIITANVLS